MVIAANLSRKFKRHSRSNKEVDQEAILNLDSNHLIEKCQLFDVF